MTESTRKRKLPFIGDERGRRAWFLKSDPRIGGIAEQAISEHADLSGTQITVSSGHPFSRRKNKRFAGSDLGGPFFSQRSYLKSGIGYTHSTDEDATYKSTYSGPIMLVLPSWAGKLSFPDLLPPSNNSALDALGATAISRCKPTNSVADLSTAIGEIMKEGLPSIIGSQTWRDRALTAKNAGSEYLNTAFGWSPLINDVSKFIGGVTSLESVMRQYERDAGRVVRRSYNFPVSRTVSTEPYGPISRPLMFPNDSVFFNGPGSQVMRTRESVRSVWFSGAFTYSLPSGYDSRTALGQYALIADRLGLELTPETLWELAPWSWAVDWFSNTGDVISNLSDFVTGGLVMRYGYVMEHSINTDTYSRPGPSGLKPSVKVAPPLVTVTETKIRRQANPFGFGVSWDGLSPFQLSILAALGMTRV